MRIRRSTALLPNVKGVFNATRAAAECMAAGGAGVILSTSSLAGISGQPGV